MGFHNPPAPVINVFLIEARKFPERVRARDDPELGEDVQGHDQARIFINFREHWNGLRQLAETAPDVFMELPCNVRRVMLDELYIAVLFYAPSDLRQKDDVNQDHLLKQRRQLIKRHV
jgi:hypothetical protein